MHSTSSNTERLTIPTGGAGKYLVGVQIAWATSAVASRRVTTIRQNGATLVAQDQRDSTTLGTANTGATVTTVYAMSAADYFDSTAYQDTGGALNAAVFANYSLEFYAFWFRN